ncbi:hypothetical protein CLJ31_001939 [Enterobacter hormaechei]|nr:hypothetical protein [Enterobacter hormaechei]
MTNTERPQNKNSYYRKIDYLLITDGYGRIWTEMDTKKATLRQLIIASLGAEGRTRTGTYFYG